MSVNLNDTLHQDGLSAFETVDLNKMLDHKDDQKLSRKESFDANKIATNLADKSKNENLDSKKTSEGLDHKAGQKSSTKETVKADEIATNLMDKTKTKKLDLEKQFERMDHKDGQKSASKKMLDANDVVTKLFGHKNSKDQLQQTNKKDEALNGTSHDDTVTQSSDASKLEKMSLFSNVFDLVSDFFGSKNRDQELEKLKLKHQAIKTNVEDLNSSIKNLASDQQVAQKNEELSSKKSELNEMIRQDEAKNIPTRKTDLLQRKPESKVSVSQNKDRVSNQDTVKDSFDRFDTEFLEPVATESVLDKAPVIQSTTQAKSASAENEMIDQRAKLIANQQTIEENISKLKLQGEK